MIFGATQRLHPLAMGRTRLEDLARDRCGADKADTLNFRVLENGVDHFAVAVHDIEYAGGHAGLRQQVCQHHGRGWIFFRRLEHESIAADQCHRDHPQGHHGRKVEWRNARYHPQGLAEGETVHAGAYTVGVLALE